MEGEPLAPAPQSPLAWALLHRGLHPHSIVEGSLAQQLHVEGAWWGYGMQLGPPVGYFLGEIPLNCSVVQLCPMAGTSHGVSAGL